VAGTLALVAPIMCSEMGSGTAEDVPAVALCGRIGKGWVAATLDGGIDKDGPTCELGGIAEWARERRGEDGGGGDGADDVEGGGFD
jgi:hypothetical protein